MTKLKTIIKPLLLPFLFTLVFIKVDAQKMSSAQKASLHTPSNIKFDSKPAERDSLVSVLEKTFDLDQGSRRKYSKAVDTYGYNSKQYNLALDSVIRQDSINQKAVFEIIDKYGWIDDNIGSKKASSGIFLCYTTCPIRGPAKICCSC